MVTVVSKGLLECSAVVGALVEPSFFFLVFLVRFALVVMCGTVVSLLVVILVDGNVLFVVGNIVVALVASGVICTVVVVNTGVIVVVGTVTVTAVGLVVMVVVTECWVVLLK